MRVISRKRKSSVCCLSVPFQNRVCYCQEVKHDKTSSSLVLCGYCGIENSPRVRVGLRFGLSARGPIYLFIIYSRSSFSDVQSTLCLFCYSGPCLLLLTNKLIAWRNGSPMLHCWLCSSRTWRRRCRAVEEEEQRNWRRVLTTRVKCSRTAAHGQSTTVDIVTVRYQAGFWLFGVLRNAAMPTCNSFTSPLGGLATSSCVMQNSVKDIPLFFPKFECL